MSNLEKAFDEQENSVVETKQQHEIIAQENKADFDSIQAKYLEKQVEEGKGISEIAEDFVKAGVTRDIVKDEQGKYSKFHEELAEEQKETLKVLHVLDKEPISITNNLAVTRCETIPQGDILTVTNIQPRTEKCTVKEPVLITEKVEETGEEYSYNRYVDVEREREYFTCDIIGTIDEKKAIRNKINKLKDWFNTNYRMYNEMLTRRASLGIEKGCVDKVRNKTYNTLNDLYLEAEIVVEEINELESKLK